MAARLSCHLRRSAHVNERGAKREATEWWSLLSPAFDVDFTAQDVALWGKPDKSFEIKDGRAQFPPDANHLWWSWNTVFGFDEADIRITITLIELAVQINDTEVAPFQGQPPDHPSFIGLLAASGGGPGRYVEFQRPQGDQRQVAARGVSKGHFKSLHCDWRCDVSGA
jgi:hypothetical protein